MIPCYTVVIPHYNSPQLLQRCLDSIPDREDIQVIVVDDNSSPQTVDFNHFPGLERQNVQVIFNKNNKGAGHARNLGLKEANGKWLLFADADDFFTGRAWDAITEHQQSAADIIYFGIASVDSDTLQPNDRKKVYGRYIEQYLGSPTEIHRETLLFRHDVPWGKMISHDLVRNHEIVFGESKYCNDTLFSTKTALAARSIHVDPTPMYCVTTLSTSLTRQDTREANMVRLEVILQKNRLLRQHGKGRYQLSLASYYRRAAKFGLKSLCRHLCLAYRSRTSVLFNFVRTRRWYSGV